MRSTIISIVILTVCTGCGKEAIPSEWQELSPLKESRSEVSSTVSGDKIYIAGGIGFFRTLKSCEVYDRKADSWSDCPELPHRLHHVAIASTDNNVYAFGGYTNLFFSHDEASTLWKLDSEKERWVKVAVGPKPIGEHAMLSYAGNLYVIGGRTPEGDSSELWQFDVVREEWRALTSMEIPRHSFAAVVVEDELWVLGGRSDELGSAIAQTEVYSFAKNTWRTGPTMLVGRGGHTAVYHEGVIHVLGGEVFDPNSVIDRYDLYGIETGKWVSQTPPPNPRHGAAAVILDDELLLIGGATRPGLSSVFSTSALVQSLDLKPYKEKTF